MKDPVSKRSRGFGFITFYDINSVDNVLANEPHTIDARKVSFLSFMRRFSSSLMLFCCLG
jgi:RNA recognition motif-containing protein